MDACAVVAVAVAVAVVVVVVVVVAAVECQNEETVYGFISSRRGSPPDRPPGGFLAIAMAIVTSSVA
jgi:hypothetical protein